MTIPLSAPILEINGKFKTQIAKVNSFLNEVSHRTKNKDKNSFSDNIILKLMQEDMN